MGLRGSFILLLVCVLQQANGGTEAEMMKALEDANKEDVPWKYIPLSGPNIDAQNSKNVSVQLGKTAILNCRVKYIGGKTVSWIRVRDLHLLTVGTFTYTSDERFKAVHQHGSADWLLKIHYAQIRDTGGYECQVSTTPPISHMIWLNVANPETKILGGPDIHINSGSTINLTCIVKHSPQPPNYILWYHEAELLAYDSPRGGITVVTEHGTSSSSRLLIQKAKSLDAGVYSCKPANSDPDKVVVHIIPSEHPAAIHGKNGTSAASCLVSSSSSFQVFCLLLITSMFSHCFPSIASNVASPARQCSNFRNKTNEKKTETGALRPLLQVVAFSKL